MKRSALFAALAALLAACGTKVSTDLLRGDVRATSWVLSVDVLDGLVPLEYPDTAMPDLHGCLGIPPGWHAMAPNATAWFGEVEVVGTPGTDAGLAATEGALDPTLQWTCWTARAGQTVPDEGHVDIEVVAPTGATGIHDVVFVVGNLGVRTTLTRARLAIDAPDHPLVWATQEVLGGGPSHTPRFAAASGDAVVVADTGGATANWPVYTWTPTGGWTDPAALAWGQVADLRYGNGQFALLGATGFATSPDGATWTVAPQPYAAPGGLAWGGAWYAAGDGALHAVVPGGTWTEVATPLDAVTGVTSDGTRLLARGWRLDEASGGVFTVLAWSDDGGNTWAEGVLPAEAGAIAHFGVAAGHVLALSGNAEALSGWSTTDGVTWDETPLGATSQSWPEPSGRAAYGLQTVDERVVIPGLVGAVGTWAPDEGFGLQRWLSSYRQDAAVLLGDDLVVAAAGRVRTGTWTHPPEIAGGSPPRGEVGTPYTWTFTSTRAVTLEVAEGPLPPGLQTSGLTEVSGTPTEAGSYDVTLRVLDEWNRYDDLAVTLVVDPAPDTADTSDTGDTGDPLDTDSGVTVEEPRECGCTTSGPSPVAWPLLFLLPFARRGRATGPRRPSGSGS